MELMGTFLLMYVVLETAVNTKSVVSDDASMIRGQTQTLAPMPIGFAVFIAHVMCVPITGCSINPTRSFGPALVANTWDHHWVWWVALLLGASLPTFLLPTSYLPTSYFLLPIGGLPLYWAHLLQLCCGGFSK